jgi:transcriptional regulator with XRE-family HTH domain
MIDPPFAWIATTVRDLRIERGMTQADLARAAGTDRSYISRLERGKHPPTVAGLCRVLAVFDHEIEIMPKEPSDAGKA